MSLDDLTLVDSIHLAAYAKCSIGPQESHFRALFQVVDPFAPSDAYAEYWLERLRQRRLLYDVGTSSNGRLLRLSPQVIAPTLQKRWGPNLRCQSHEIYAQVTERIRHRPETTCEQLSELTSLWRDLSVAEAHAHLASCLINLKFEPHLADVAASSFSLLSEHFSIAELFYLSWVISRDFVAKVPRRADNDLTILQDCLRGTAEARARSVFKNNTIRPFSRLAKLPESAVSTIFSRTATALGDRYLTECPREETIAGAIE